MMAATNKLNAMTKTEAQAWRDRWKAVNAVQEAEQLASTMEQRWLEANGLRLLAHDISLSLNTRDDAAEAVSRRWVHLHRLGVR